ncbi:MAG: YkgJ family cysteine cluster protein [Chitinivibrionales bacterium]|nr:YkgJ family cysteine cluster protein [Chitinivibrionales bacterium]
MKSKNDNQTSPCTRCEARCCKHIALQIETPSCKRDYDNIRWFLLHKNVKVFKDHDNEWLIEFSTECENLLNNHRCGDYENRPKVCRDYPGNEETCESDDDCSPYKLLFSSARQFEEYLDKKKINWRWKNQQ